LRDAAIREHEAALTLANTEIRNTPVGIEIDRGYGDWLWGKDVRLENVSKAASSSATRTTSTPRSGSRPSARNMPVFAHFRDSGKNVEGRGRNYQLTEFTHGLKLPGLGEPGHFDHQTGRIDVPARPLQLVFGGPDKRTLFILTHHALYSTRI
jgi:hypothetical protein